jgi:hypothetical protein
VGAGPRKNRQGPGRRGGCTSVAGRVHKCRREGVLRLETCRSKEATGRGVRSAGVNASALAGRRVWGTGIPRTQGYGGAHGHPGEEHEGAVTRGHAEAREPARSAARGRERAGAERRDPACGQGLCGAQGLSGARVRQLVRGHADPNQLRKPAAAVTTPFASRLRSVVRGPHTVCGGPTTDSLLQLAHLKLSFPKGVVTHLDLQPTPPRLPFAPCQRIKVMLRGMVRLYLVFPVLTPTGCKAQCQFSLSACRWTCECELGRGAGNSLLFPKGDVGVDPTPFL